MRKKLQASGLLKDMYNLFEKMYDVNDELIHLDFRIAETVDALLYKLEDLEEELK